MKANCNIADSNSTTTEVRERPERRRYPAEYRARVLKELAEAAHGEKGAILRREGLYPSKVFEWSQEAKGMERAKKKGRKKDVLAEENRKLRKELERAKKQLDQANQIIDLQKKVSEILGITLQAKENNE